MKKMILVAGVVGLLLAAPAPATTSKTVAVDISSVGFVPAAVTVQTGDTVVWTNKDTGNHQVVCATCPFTSSVLAPGQTASFQFTKAGRFGTVDPLNKNKKGTVTVTAAAAGLTVSATPRTVTYGGTTTISGTLSTGQANQKLDILGQQCGENAAKAIASVNTATGGNFTFPTQPQLTTSYQVRTKGGGAVTSSAVSVSVRPIVKLRRNGVHRFTAQVIAGQSFVGKAVVFQRWVTKRHRWTRVKTVFLGTRSATTTPLAASTVSGVTFGARLARGLRVRAVLSSGQAGPCYIAASSATIRS